METSIDSFFLKIEKKILGPRQAEARAEGPRGRGKILDQSSRSCDHLSVNGVPDDLFHEDAFDGLSLEGNRVE